MRNAYTFLSHYINAKHSVTKEILPKLLEGRVFSSHIRRLEFSEVAYHAKWSSTSNENCGHEWWRSITWLANIYDLCTHNRHIDQKHFQEPGESLPVSVVIPMLTSTFPVIKSPHPIHSLTNKWWTPAEEIQSVTKIWISIWAVTICICIYLLHDEIQHT